MDNPATQTTAIGMTPLLPRDVALPETPAPSRIVKEGGSERGEEEQEERAEFKGEEESAGKEIVRLGGASGDDDESIDAPVAEISSPGDAVGAEEVKEGERSAAVPPVGDEPDGTIDTGKPTDKPTSAAHLPVDLERTPVELKVEMLDDADAMVGSVSEVPSFPPGPTIGSPIREAAVLNPLSPIVAQAELPAVDDEEPAEERTSLDAVVKKASEVPEVDRELEEEEELVPVEDSAGIEVFIEEPVKSEPSVPDLDAFKAEEDSLLSPETVEPSLGSSLETRDRFCRSATQSPSSSRLELTPGENPPAVAATPGAMTTPSPEDPLAASVTSIPIELMPKSVETLPQPEPTSLDNKLDPSTIASALASEYATLDDLIRPEEAVTPGIFPLTPLDEEETRQLEEQVAEVPPVETKEEVKEIAEGLSLGPSEAAVVEDEKEASQRVVVQKTELHVKNLESELQEQRTSVLVTPPKDASLAPPFSSAKAVFVENPLSLVGEPMLAELLHDQAPALECTQEELEERAKEAAPVADASKQVEVQTEPPSSGADAYFEILGSAPDTEGKPLHKTQEQLCEEIVAKKLEEGALGGLGAALVGSALAPSKTPNIQAADAEKIMEKIGRVQAEVSDEETVDGDAYEGGSPLVPHPPKFASMTDTAPSTPAADAVLNRLLSLPSIPTASTGLVPDIVLNRIAEHHDEKFATGEGLETSTRSNWAEPATTPGSELPPSLDEMTTPKGELAIQDSASAEASPAATPGEVFSRGDVPAGTLLSSSGERKEMSDITSESLLDALAPTSPTYFGSTLPLPREIDYAADSAILEVAASAPVSEAAVQQVELPVAELLTTKEDDVEVGREEATVTADSLPQPQDPTLFSPLVVAERIASEAQPSPATDLALGPTKTPVIVTLPPHSRDIPDIMNLRWSLKDVTWPDPRVGGERRDFRIVCQSGNGPCSLISLVNCLALRGSIHINPALQHVSYDYLSSLIGDFLIERPQNSELSLASALSILPTTVEGLNLNPSFLSPSSFEQEGDGGELALFELCGVKLTHGWVVESEEDRELMGRVGTWDAAQSALVEGQVAEAELEKSGGLTDEGLRKIEDANRVRTFLDSTRTQLTSTGLRALSDSLESQEVVALFRNSHLSVLYKRPASDPADPIEPLLFSLVTDEAFRKEPEVVWEPLADVHTSTGFLNSEFIISSTAGGDIAGLSAEEVGRRADIENGGTGEDDLDQQLAKQLQSEEDASAAASLANETASSRRPSSRRRSGLPATPGSPPAGARHSVDQGRGQFAVSAAGGTEELRKVAGEKEKKKGKGCVLM